MSPSRRQFFKRAAVALASLVLAPALLARAAGDAQGAEAKLPPLTDADPTAKALGYHPSAAKVDVAKWPKRAGAGGKSQKCSSCMFYTGADKKTGKCQIFPKNSVNADGWCNSWSKKT